MVKVCQFCGKSFKARRSNQKYCSTSCWSYGQAEAYYMKLHPDSPPKPRKRSERELMRERLAERDAAYAAWQSENGVADRSTVYADVHVVNRGTVPVAARPPRSELRIARV